MKERKSSTAIVFPSAGIAFQATIAAATVARKVFMPSPRIARMTARLGSFSPASAPYICMGGTQVGLPALQRLQLSGCCRELGYEAQILVVVTEIRQRRNRLHRHALDRPSRIQRKRH